MSTDQWVRFRSTPDQPQLRLLCFPFAGGTATNFRLWARHLPDHVEFCPVEYPGHGTRRAEPLINRIPKLVESAAAGLADEFDSPYALYGHSLGSIVAFELARHMTAAGKPPAHLFVSGRKAPQLQRPHKDMHKMSDDAFVDAIMQRYGGIPQEVLDEPELLAMMMPMARADIEMYELYAYAPGEQLPCRISTFAGEEDHSHPPAELNAWNEQSVVGCTSSVLPGGHFFINTHKDLFLQRLSQQLNELV
jgi:surfactin synthase thioesterase subunit